MTQNKKYSYAAAVYPFGVTLYYFDSNHTNVIEMVELESRTFQQAMQRQWRLFKKFETLETNVELRVSLN